MLRAFLLVSLLSVAAAACSPEAERPAEFEGTATLPPPAAPQALAPESARLWDPADEVWGERIYVPVYSHIYFRNARRDIDLAATLSVRNTDAEHAIRLAAVDYYDSAGALVRRYLDAPRDLGPMASTDFLVEQEDDTGGVGANFIVEWRSDRAVSSPVIEAVMISATSSQGISFVTQGRVLQRARSAPPASSE